MSPKFFILPLAISAITTAAVGQPSTTVLEPPEKTTPVITLKVDSLSCTTSLGSGTFLMTVKLQTVGIAQFQLGGSPGSDNPAEQISFSFQRITVTNNQNNRSAGWDITTGKAI